MTGSATSIPELERIWLLLEHHRPQLAEQLARQRLAADPAGWATFLALAAALQQLNRLTEAREAAQAAIRIAPEAAEAHYALAQVRGQLGQLHETITAVDEALRLAPHQAEYYGYRAQLFYVQRRYAEAVKCGEAGLRIDPQQPNCLLWRALAQEARDRPHAADQDFDLLLQVAPESALVHSHLGQLLLKRFEPRAAEPHLAEALRQSPEEAAQLVPLLQSARQLATWPAWLLGAVRREASERTLGVELGFRTLPVRLAVVAYTSRAEWLNRHDPLFQLHNKPALLRPWASSPPAWAALAMLLAAAIYLNVTLRLRAGPAIFMMAIFAVQYMRKRQSKDNSFPRF
ncbi:MAG TPA: tetratricopeptide repeat protein [Hymenobacter sp.]|jgi:tetratricopeptide (TPR) repeat protein|uniref:tetratricopeptide repeat protein n=1 Tax=Hymenobacter sp. TaxID=1898978 RepID=UPI002ED8DD0C